MMLGQGAARRGGQRPGGRPGASLSARRSGQKHKSKSRLRYCVVSTVVLTILLARKLRTCPIYRVYTSLRDVGARWLGGSALRGRERLWAVHTALHM